jgi:hypothetical protein
VFIFRTVFSFHISVSLPQSPVKRQPPVIPENNSCSGSKKIRFDSEDVAHSPLETTLPAVLEENYPNESESTSIPDDGKSFSFYIIK